MSERTRLGYITKAQEEDAKKNGRHCVLPRMGGPCSATVVVTDGSVDVGEEPFRKLWCYRCGSIPWERTAAGRPVSYQEVYPGPWHYDEGNMWVTRQTDEDGGEIWCEFREPPDEDELEWLLGQLNAWEASNSCENEENEFRRS